jgi:hypothetical protein
MDDWVSRAIHDSHATRPARLVLSRSFSVVVPKDRDRDRGRYG